MIVAILFINTLMSTTVYKVRSGHVRSRTGHARRGVKNSRRQVFDWSATRSRTVRHDWTNATS